MVHRGAVCKYWVMFYTSVGWRCNSGSSKRLQTQTKELNYKEHAYKPFCSAIIWAAIMLILAKICSSCHHYIIVMVHLIFNDLAVFSWRYQSVCVWAKLHASDCFSLSVLQSPLLLLYLSWRVCHHHDCWILVPSHHPWSSPGFGFGPPEGCPHQSHHLL